MLSDYGMSVGGNLRGTAAEFPFGVGGRRRAELPGSREGGHRFPCLSYGGK